MNTKELADIFQIDYIPLNIHGVDSVAFSHQYVFRMLDVLQAEVIPVLGGDVYIQNNGIIYSTYDNWNTIRAKNESLNEFAMNSCRRSINYINRYIATNLPLKEYILFDLVI